MKPLFLITLLGLTACTMAGGFGNSDKFYYSRTTSFLWFSWSDIYWCENSGDKKVDPRIDCKLVSVNYGSNNKSNTSASKSSGFSSDSN